MRSETGIKLYREAPRLRDIGAFFIFDLILAAHLVASQSIRSQHVFQHRRSRTTRHSPDGQFHGEDRETDFEGRGKVKQDPKTGYLEMQMDGDALSISLIEGPSWAIESHSLFAEITTPGTKHRFLSLLSRGSTSVARKLPVCTGRNRCHMSHGKYFQRFGN